MTNCLMAWVAFSRWNLEWFAYKLTGPSDAYHFSLATDPNECGVTVVSEGGRRYSSISEIVPARDRRDVRFLLSSPLPTRDSDKMNGEETCSFFLKKIGRHKSFLLDFFIQTFFPCRLIFYSLLELSWQFDSCILSHFTTCDDTDT